MATGIALLGTVGSIIYRHRIDHGDLAGQWPDRWSEPVREHLSGAVHAAAHLSEPVRDALLDAAKGAFMAGFQIVGGLSTVLLTGLIVLFLTVMRKVKRAEAIE